MTSDDLENTERAHRPIVDAALGLGRGASRLAQQMDWESSTLSPTLWWLCLWTGYIGAACLPPVFHEKMDSWPGGALVVVLLVMVVLFLMERDWLGTMLLNCLISIPVVPLLFVGIVIRALVWDGHWGLGVEASFLGVQALALLLAWLHLVHTKKRFHTFPPKHLRPKRTLPEKPTLGGPAKLGAMYLSVLGFMGSIYGLVAIKRVFPELHVPVFFAVPVLLTLFLAAGGIGAYWIGRKLKDR